MPLTLTAPGTTLRVAPYRTRATVLGPDNPFPPMHKNKRSKVDPNDRAHMRKHQGLRAGYGAGGTLLPYGVQDGYSRALKPRTFQSVVLENRHLRATFLPELGGRLWSLVHKQTRRELLDVNPAIQLANLAFRDAWFSGGVEWNVCPVGHHTPLTCSPLFAGVLRLDDGTPVLRLWEWERRLQIAYQIDAWLPADATFLRVRFRIHNGHDRTLPLYQWSNIAVPETPDTRVLIPAQKAFVNRYEGRGMRTTLETMPVYRNVDVSIPTNGQSSRDYFFALRKGRPWITALRGDGAGLVQTSTPRQTGRKLFIWGQSVGGHRWQEYLNGPNHRYIEIQAGLARTQLESIPMPAGATWDWLEGYGLMQADPAITHGANWTAAHKHVDRTLSAALPLGTLERDLRDTDAMASRQPEIILQRGSGWGALERKRLECAGALEPAAPKLQRAGGPSVRLPWAPGIVFDDQSLGPDQAPWLHLLQHGTLPTRAVTDTPGAFQVSEPWHALLARSALEGRAPRGRSSSAWLAWFHLGVMRYDAHNSDAPARTAWETSMRLKPNPWAARCLARLAARKFDLEQTAHWLQRARRLLPADARLAAETCDVFRVLRRPAAVRKVIASLPPAARRADRVLLAQAWTALDAGDYVTALDIILGHEFASIREGELSLASIWFRAHEIRISKQERIPLDHALRLRVRRECQPPAAIDMRMKLGTPEEEVAADEHAEAKLARIRARAARVAARRGRM